MKKPRLATRIREALVLQPMTVHQLATCLSVTDSCAQQALAALTRRRIVKRNGWMGMGMGRHRPYLFELAQCQPLNARQEQA